MQARSSTPNTTLLCAAKNNIANNANTNTNTKNNAFYVIDKQRLRTNHSRWMQHMPRITPHYAVKCNDDPGILSTLAEDCSTGFDCASLSEMHSVLQYDNVSPSSIIFAHPIKEEHSLVEARRLGIRQMTADSSEEIVKIARLHPKAEVMLRILVDDSQAICQLGTKFGASMDEVPDILHTAAAHSVNIMGVAFHVGSGQTCPDAFANAVRRARLAFDWAHNCGFDMRVLNIGGGFVDDSSFVQVAQTLNATIDQCFGNDVDVIAEPGRFYVQESTSLVTSVIGMKKHKNVENEDSVMLFVNDSIYGSFNNVIFDHANVQPTALLRSDGSEINVCNTDTRCTIWGQTCDGMDKICAQSLVNKEDVTVGDWLYWPSMGAYTSSAWSSFNGFLKPSVVYVDEVEKMMEEEEEAAVEIAC